MISQPNPYRSPPDALHDANAGLIETPVARELTQRQHRRVGHGIRCCFAGLAAFAIVLLGGMAKKLFQNDSIGTMFASDSWLLIAAMPGVCVGFVGVVSGCVFFMTVPGTRRLMCIVALILFLTGMSGTTSVVFRLAAAGRMLGLMPLFAASTYAMLFTSLAILAMILRSLAEQIGLGISKLMFEVAVLLFAISAASASLIVMMPSSMVEPLQMGLIRQSLSLSLLVVVPGVWLLAAGTGFLLHTWPRTERRESIRHAVADQQIG